MPSSTLIGLNLRGSKFRSVYPASWLYFSTVLDRDWCQSSQTGLGEGVSSVLLLGPEGSKFTQFMSKGPSETIKNNSHYLDGKTEALELENPKESQRSSFPDQPTPFVNFLIVASRLYTGTKFRCFLPEPLHISRRPCSVAVISNHCCGLIPVKTKARIK